MRSLGVVFKHAAHALAPPQIVYPSIMPHAGRHALAPSGRSRSRQIGALSAVSVADAGSVPSALVATGHYWSIIIAYSLLATERLLVKVDPTAEEATRISLVDAGYGIVGLGILYSGYLRATQYAKGWEFYSHSPFFWAKMLALGILTALSLYPTITFIQVSLLGLDVRVRTQRCGV